MVQRNMDLNRKERYGSCSFRNFECFRYMKFRIFASWPAIG